MKRKSATPTKKRVTKKRTVSPPKNTKEDNSFPVKPFHETFPITLEYKEGNENKKCCFMCEEHCISYIKRHKLKKDSYKLYKTKPKSEEET